jgi:hypothetical protein
MPGQASGEPRRAAERPDLAWAICLARPGHSCWTNMFSTLDKSISGFCPQRKLERARCETKSVGNQNMNAVDALQNALFAYKFGLGNVKACVNWAVERLMRDEEGDDNDVVLLAGSTDGAETLALTYKIVDRYLPPDARREELWAGRLQIWLYERYQAGAISIVQLDLIINNLYVDLKYPNWLTMLSRNCEYATDVDRFRKPFEDEFKYIRDLWAVSTSLEDFYNRYDRRVSNTHDLPEIVNYWAKLSKSNK